MKICLVHIGNQLPSYFYDCVKQIRRYFQGQVYVVFESALRTDDILKYNLIHVPIEKYLNTDRVNEFEKTCRAGNFTDFFNDSFWAVTFKRIFILEEVIKDYKLSDVVHMENDILIYQNPEDIKFKEIYVDKVAVNPVGERYSTYAYCYIPNYESIKNVNNRNIEILSEGYKTLLSRYGEGMVNEMMVLKQILDEDKYVDILPSLPQGITSKHLDKLNILTDPASFGQFVGGTRDCIPGFAGKHHYIGREIMTGKYNIVWINNVRGNKEPFVKFNGNNVYKLNNLHIHSKQLDKWM